MKMAKASAADIDMAIELAAALAALSSYWGAVMPPKLQGATEEDAPFSIDDADDCRRVLRYLIQLDRRASLFRVAYGMAVLLDPRNKIVDPDADTLEHHPDTVAALDAWSAGVFPVDYGSQKPDDDGPHSSTAPVRAGSKTPPKGANRDASTEQSHGAAGSESPPGRGTNGAPALGAAPAFIPTLGPQQVLKAEAARPDATARGNPAASPGGGPMGVWQPAAAGPAGNKPA